MFNVVFEREIRRQTLTLSHLISLREGLACQVCHAVFRHKHKDTQTETDIDDFTRVPRIVPGATGSKAGDVLNTMPKLSSITYLTRVLFNISSSFKLIPDDCHSVVVRQPAFC